MAEGAIVSTTAKYTPAQRQFQRRDGESVSGPGSGGKWVLHGRENPGWGGLIEDAILKIPACRQAGRILNDSNGTGDSASRVERQETLVNTTRFPISNVCVQRFL